jgi:hypothetical protein
MRQIDVYLAHRNSLKFIEQQILLIRKFFKCNEGSIINIFCYVDGDNEEINIESSVIYNYSDVDRRLYGY